MDRRVLKRGDVGPDVEAIQRKLGIKPTGDFGRHTEFAVREWQAFHDLPVDGVIGPATYAKLYPEPKEK